MTDPMSLFLFYILNSAKGYLNFGMPRHPSTAICKRLALHCSGKLKLHKNLNIFHANVNGLESKFDTLNNFLAGATSPIDIVALTETSEDSVISFISNVSVDDYSLFSTPTNSSKGGVCLYVNSEFDAFERSDLKVQNDLFEMVWIEIKNKNSKNVLCGCVYRHPRYEMDDFLATYGFFEKNN